MGRRERLEARAERRREWAAKREARAAERFNAARRAVDGIPFGQPVLVGHHSEKHHRAALARQDAAMRAGAESADMAKHHEQAAAGIEHQLARSIFSDDENAPEALEAKAAKLDAGADRWKALGAAWRKRKEDDPGARLAAMHAAGIITEAEAREAARNYALQPYHRTPWPGYHLTNLRANARRCRERIAQIKREEARKAEAEAAPGGVLLRYSDDRERVSVTFPDYPGRETVAALKAAGFWWNRPSWYGKAADLPASVRAMLPADDVCPDGPACADPACVAERARRAEGVQP